MNRTKMFIHVMLGGMLLVPLTYFLQNTSEAAVVPVTLQEDLLLTELPVGPHFDQIHKLTRSVFATYFVKEREDLWAISQRFGVDQFTIKSSNDLENPFPAAGTLLRIPNSKGTL